jgi:hypothetical protein
VEEIMKVKTLAISSVSALVLLTGSAANAAWADAWQCGVDQRHLLRVAMSVATTETPLDAFTIARAVDRLWAHEGVDIDWIEETRVDDRLDAWVVIGRTASESASVASRANILGHPMVWISIDEIVARFEQRLSLQLQVPRETARHMLLGAQLLERALGYAIAHELGHSSLGLSHASAGPMSADYGAPPELTAVVARDLDPANRGLLQKRFGIGCLAAR